METWRWRRVNIGMETKNIKTWRNGDMETWTWNFDVLRKKIKRKTEAQTIFLNPFTVCSSCKRKFVFVYPFASGLNGFAHLW